MNFAFLHDLTSSYMNFRHLLQIHDMSRYVHPSSSMFQGFSKGDSAKPYSFVVTFVGAKSCTRQGNYWEL